MIVKLCNNLYTGSTEGLVFTGKDWFIVSATQRLHYYHLGWTKDTVDKASKDYLYRTFKNRLTLNWVDGPKHLFEWYTPDKFAYFLDLLESNVQSRKVFIHCDQGKSRGPSLALLFMAKRLGTISSVSASHAHNDFLKKYPSYSPGGIFNFLNDNWGKLY